MRVMVCPHRYGMCAGTKQGFRLAQEVLLRADHAPWPCDTQPPDRGKCDPSELTHWPGRNECAVTPESSEAVQGNHALCGVSRSEEVRKPHVEVLHRSGLKYHTIARFGLVESNYAADAQLHEAGDVLLGSPCMCLKIRSGTKLVAFKGPWQMTLTPSSSSAMYASTSNVSRSKKPARAAALSPWRLSQIETAKSDQTCEERRVGPVRRLVVGVVHDWASCEPAVAQEAAQLAAGIGS